MVLPRRALRLALAAGLVWSSPAAAQDGGLAPAHSPGAIANCRAALALEVLTAAQAADEEQPCEVLGVVLIDKYEVEARRAAKSIPSMELDLGPSPDLGRGAVASLQPSPAAGATAAVAGTESGPRVVTEIRLNPLSLIGLGSNDQVRASASRALDVVALLPISTETGLQTIDHFGLRLHYNALGSRTAGQLLEKTSEIFSEKSQFEDAQLGLLISSILRERGAEKKCIDALMAADPAAQERHCKAAVTEELKAKLVELNRRLIASVDALREELDRRYLGLDLKADFGDPRLTGKPEARATTLVGSVAGGQAAGDEAKTRWVQVRLRAGLAYSYEHATRAVSYGFDWGAGLDLSAVLDRKAVRLGLGLEGRHGGPAATGDTNFVDARLSVSVPLSDGSALAVSVSLPFAQPPGANRKPTLNVSGNWELLVPILKQL